MKLPGSRPLGPGPPPSSPVGLAAGAPTAAFITGKALAGAMTMEPREVVANRLRQTDPRRALAEDPLSQPMLQETPRPDARGGALAHIRSRDPRARLDAASAQLHGGIVEGMPAGDASELPDATPQRRLRTY